MGTRAESGTAVVRRMRVLLCRLRRRWAGLGNELISVALVHRRSARNPSVRIM